MYNNSLSYKTHSFTIISSCICGLVLEILVGAEHVQLTVGSANKHGRQALKLLLVECQLVVEPSVLKPSVRMWNTSVHRKEYLPGESDRWSEYEKPTDTRLHD